MTLIGIKLFFLRGHITILTQEKHLRIPSRSSVGPNCESPLSSAKLVVCHVSVKKWLNRALCDTKLNVSQRWSMTL